MGSEMCIRDRSFIGAWLGGRIFDSYQDYTPMWIAAVVLGVLATLIHLPIREAPGPLATQALSR